MHSVPLYVVKYMICFLILQGLQLRDCPESHKKLWTFSFLNSVEIIIDYGIFEVGLNAFLLYDIKLQAYGGQEVKCGGFNKNDSHRLIYLNAWSLGSGSI